VAAVLLLRAAVVEASPKEGPEISAQSGLLYNQPPIATQTTILGLGGGYQAH
jgi:hypothetical protein